MSVALLFPVIFSIASLFMALVLLHACLPKYFSARNRWIEKKSAAAIYRATFAVQQPQLCYMIESRLDPVSVCEMLACVMTGVFILI